MYQVNYYDEEMSDSDQDLIEEILGAPIDKSMYTETRYANVPPVVSSVREQNILQSGETAYQVITQEVPIQTNVFTAVQNQPPSAPLTEPVKSYTETSIPLTSSIEPLIPLTSASLATKEEVAWTGELPVSQYPINEDSNPEIIRKVPEDVIYNQDITIKYLKPPLPPPHGELIIRQERSTFYPPAPPVVIRQQPKAPENPPPLVIRERPPPQPLILEKKVVSLPGRKIPPPPRRVIIERLPLIPPKPQQIIIERWLQYEEQKRKVVFMKAPEDIIPPKPRNLIIQWDSPKVLVRKQYIDLGVSIVNPEEYIARFGSSLISYEQLPDFVKEIRPPENLRLANQAQLRTLLEGDIDALSLIDLDKEGLSEYKSYLKTTSDIYSRSYLSSWPYTTQTTFEKVQKPPTSSFDLMFEEALSTIQPLNRETLSINEARVIMALMFQKLNKKYSETESERILTDLNPNKTDFINLSQFKNALLKIST